MKPVLVLPILLAACATTAAPSADGWAALGGTTRAGPVLVRPIRVVEDNRCPMNARCAWAGRVVVEARLRLGDRAQTARIASDQPFAIGTGSLALEEILPASFMTGDVPEPGEYRFRFEYR